METQNLLQAIIAELQTANDNVSGIESGVSIISDDLTKIVKSIVPQSLFSSAARFDINLYDPKTTGKNIASEPQNNAKDSRLAAANDKNTQDIVKNNTINTHEILKSTQNIIKSTAINTQDIIKSTQDIVKSNTINIDDIVKSNTINAQDIVKSNIINVKDIVKSSVTNTQEVIKSSVTDTQTDIKDLSKYSIKQYLLNITDGIKKLSHLKLKAIPPPLVPCLFITAAASSLFCISPSAFGSSLHATPSLS